MEERNDRAPWTPSAQSMNVAFAGRIWRIGGFVEKDNRFLPLAKYGPRLTVGPGPSLPLFPVGKHGGAERWSYIMESFGCLEGHSTLEMKVISRP